MSAPERTVAVRPRTVLSVLGIVLGVGIVLFVIWATRGVFGWIILAILLAIALDPAVEHIVKRGLRRTYAALLVFVIAAVVAAGIGYVLVPPLVTQIREFIDAVPGIVDELTRGEGPLGFLEREFKIVERTREAIDNLGASGVFGITGTAFSVAQGVITVVVGVVTTAFLTLFLLIDGRRLVERFLGYLPERPRARWERIGIGVYRTVGGYVSGNIFLSVIAGLLSWIALFALDVPYAVSLAVLVALFDLLPLFGATVSGVIVVLVALATKGWVIALVFGIYFIVYQQLENHLLQPVVYRRTVSMSPVIILIAVLIGADLAGIVGALVAIPIAGGFQVLLGELLGERARSEPEAAVRPPPE